MSTTPLLKTNNLSVSFCSEGKEHAVVKNSSFGIYKNEILGIVGESGSGKSVSSLALLGLLPKETKIGGTVFFEDRSILTLSEKQFRTIRGNKISMIFQEPMSSLNPSLTCGYQVLEIILQHTSLRKKEAKAKVIDLFEKVKLPRPNEIYKHYPHQLSGGQKQRVMIAMAIACKPQLLIADEPTTALDVTIQKEIIQLLKDLQQETEMSILFISHDLALVSEICQRVLVMYQGEIVEHGTVKAVFEKPKDPYTKALIRSKPSQTRRLKKLPSVIDFIENTVDKSIYTKKERSAFHQKIYAKKPFLEIRNLKKEYVGNKTWWFQKNSVVKAINDISFELYEGETLGLVGESGCGKSTLGRTLVHLEKATSGQIFYQEKDITQLSEREKKSIRKDIQIIFQDPFSSLNPRLMVGEAILEPMKVHQLYSSTSERKAKVLEILEKVGLAPEHYNRYPHEFSGGQRQRIGIARAIALQPKLIVCDESVSALDVSVQAQVLNLLNDLKKDFGFTYIFISHDLSVVKYMSDQLVVMNQGKIEEIGDADALYAQPKSSYTQKLIDAIPKGK
jgi:peptide/nickel transport system ATP-binding protein